jgi:GTP-binding protein
VSKATEWRILEAEFVTSADTVAALPKTELLEAAFVGRSNVGKSSLLNALCGRKNLARTSKTPGRTQLYNYFSVRLAAHDAEGKRVREVAGHFVDLPGYGYAQTSKTMRAGWAKMIERYLLEREQLAAVCLLVDARRVPGEEECWIAEMGAEGGLVPIVTKTDKLKKNEQLKRQKAIALDLGVPFSGLILSSSAPRKQLGLDRILSTLGAKLTPRTAE